MGLFDLGFEHDRRAEFFENVLSPNFKATYCEGNEKLKAEFFKDNVQESFINMCNALVGEMYNFRYCLMENYYSTKNSTNYVTFGSVIIHRDLPEFCLVSKKVARNMLLIHIGFAIFACLVNSFALPFAITAFFDITNKTAVYSIYSILALLFFSITIFYFMSSYIKRFYEIYHQNILKNSGEDFKQKYVILAKNYLTSTKFFNEDEKYNINKVFTNKICSDLLKIKDEIIKFETDGNFLVFEFKKEKITEKDAANYIQQMLEVADIFSQEEELTI